jgi:hypothetical protein
VSISFLDVLQERDIRERKCPFPDAYPRSSLPASSDRFSSGKSPSLKYPRFTITQLERRHRNKVGPLHSPSLILISFRGLATCSNIQWKSLFFFKTAPCLSLFKNPCGQIQLSIVFLRPPSLLKFLSNSRHSRLHAVVELRANVGLIPKDSSTILIVDYSLLRICNNVSHR